MSDRLFTAKEVARILNVHPNTVKRLGERGELAYFRLNHRGDLRYRQRDLDEFLALRYVARRRE